MLITQRQYPVLGYLNAASLDKVGIHEKYGAEFIKSERDIQRLWQIHCPLFLGNVNIISQPFSDAFQRAQKSLIDGFPDYLDTFVNQVIFGAIIDRNHSICYYINKGDIAHKVDITLFMFQEANLVLVVYAKMSGKEESFMCPVEYGKENLTGVLGEVLMLEMFKKYAKIETKELPANKKVKDFHCKYVNQTDVKVTILDSTWFTNLVKSDAFKVRGHFRLQPKKVNGQPTKELIWINEFAKKGYTRQAKQTAVYPQQ